MINHVPNVPEVSVIDAQSFCMVFLGAKLAKPTMENGPLLDRLCVGDVVVQIYDTHISMI